MTKLTKHPRSELRLVREFAPVDPSDARSAGRLTMRATNYGSPLDRFDKFFDVMAADMLTFEPPIELDREDPEIVQYGGERIKRTFGLEVTIPAGHIVPDTYVRIQSPEKTL